MAYMTNQWLKSNPQRQFSKTVSVLVGTVIIFKDIKFVIQNEIE